MSFHVGQKVVCVDDRWRNKHGPPPRVKRGRIYTIAAIFDLPHAVRNPCVDLVEVPDDDGWSYHADRFRPLTERKTDISIFKEMLVGAPKEMEPAE